MSDEETETQTADEVAEAQAKPAGCYQHESGMFIHRSPHTCPSYLQGAKRNVRRMRP